MCAATGFDATGDEWAASHDPKRRQRTFLVIARLIVATFIIFATRSYFKVKSSPPIE
jgi:hypothetical protein